MILYLNTKHYIQTEHKMHLFQIIHNQQYKLKEQPQLQQQLEHIKLE